MQMNPDLQTNIEHLWNNQSELTNEESQKSRKECIGAT